MEVCLNYKAGPLIPLVIDNPSFITEGVTVISEETYGQLMDTFDNVEQEEFFEVCNYVQ